jgi:membrane-associated protease RseP (regulator of RpoE activity)
VNRYLVAAVAAAALFVGSSPAAAQEEPDQPKAPARAKKAAFLGVQTSPEPTKQKGVLVTEVLPKTPAAKAGIRKGDVITRLDDQAISSPEDLQRAVRKTSAGKEVTLSVERGDQKLQLKATLEETPRDLIGQLPPGAFPGSPGFRPMAPQQLLELPDRVRQLQDRVDELERRVRALEKERGKTSEKTRTGTP